MFKQRTCSFDAKVDVNGKPTLSLSVGLMNQHLVFCNSISQLGEREHVPAVGKYLLFFKSPQSTLAKDRLQRSCDDQQKKIAKYFQFHLSIKAEISQVFNHSSLGTSNSSSQLILYEQETVSKVERMKKGQRAANSVRTRNGK